MRGPPALVSVVLPVHDGADTICEQLDALASQDYPDPWELIVVNDGSRDATRQRLERAVRTFPRPMRIIDLATRRGPSAARNAGAATARGDLLAFCDADDIATPHWLSALAAAAPAGDLISGTLDTSTLNRRAVRAWQQAPRWLRAGHRFGETLSTASGAVWRDVFASLDGFDESRQVGEDKDLSWRARGAGYRLVKAPQAVVAYRYRTTLGSVARQRFHYGLAEARLTGDFGTGGAQAGGAQAGGPQKGPRGGQGVPTAIQLLTWAWSAATLPLAVVSHQHRGRWTVRTAQQAGRVVGRSRPRASRAKPRPALHLLEAGLTSPLETYVADKLERLAARGLRVTATVVREPGGSLPRLKGVKVVTQPHWAEPQGRMLAGVALNVLGLAPRHPLALATAIRAAWAAPRKRRLRRLRAYLAMAELRPDVVHFEWGSAAILYRPLTERWGRPVVISCHGSEVNVRPHLPSADRFTRSLRQSLASAAAVHCVSSAVAAEAHRLRAKPTQTWLIPPAVDTGAFRPRPRPETSASARPLRIVAVGHLRWLKGHEYALAALRVLLTQGIPATLELIGDDPDFAMAEATERERLGAAIRSLDLSSAADVTGGLSHEEVRRRLQKADVLLHLSLSEGCSVAVLEAMACSLPVVVSDHPGVRETVTDGEHGFVVPLRDPYAAAQALRVLAEDPQRRRSMGAAARIRVVQAFDVTAQIDQFVHAYERLAGNPDQPPSPRRHRADAADQSPLPSRLAPPPELRILSLGPWPWMQSYDIVLAAVRRLQDRGLPCRYRIVGAGQLSDALWFARHQFGLESQVEVVQDSTGRYAAHADWADVILDPPLGAGVPAEPGKTLSTAADDLAKRLAATHPHTIPALRADSVQPRVQPVATA